jgi:putative peptidoglycan lipid II flippase
MSSGNRVARAAGLLMVAMMISRILGFIREAVLARSFGATGVTDAFLAAFTIPDLLYDLLVGGVLSAAFMPVFSSYLANEKEEDAWEVANTVMNLVTLIMLICIPLGMYFAVPLTKLVAYKFTGETLDLSVKLTRIMFPAFIVLALNGLIMGILNSYKHFTAPALGTIAYNLAIIFFGLALNKKFGITAFAIGVVAGHISNFLIQLPALKRKGMRYRFVLNLRHPGVKKMLLLMVPAMLGLAASRLIYIVNQNFASAINEGSITALRLAYRLMWLPLGVFAGAIANAIFPTMNIQAARRQIDDLKKTMSMGIRAIFLIIIPASVGLAVLSVPIVRLLFENDKFTAASTELTAYILIFYCIGLFAHAAVWIVTRAYYSLHDTWRPVIVAITTIVLNIPLSRMFISMGLAEKGLALAFSLTGIYNLVVLLYFLRKKIGRIDVKRLVKSFVLITISSAAMGIVTYFVSSYLGAHLDLAHSTGRALQVGGSIIVGLIVFIVAILMCRLEETEMIAGIIRRKLKRA